jgi:hypothetical protein
MRWHIFLVAAAAAAAADAPCSCGRMGYARQADQDGVPTMLPAALLRSARLGNALSPYWQARAMAHLGGAAFSYQGSAAGWTDQLPKHVPARTACQREAFAAACDACAGAGEFAHKCPGAWPHIVADIQRDTRSALAQHAMAHNLRLPSFRAGDVLIQVRCAGDTVLGHDEYGPAPWSFYNSVPCDKLGQITVQSEAASVAAVPLCAALNASLFARLALRCPTARLRYVSGSLFEDWARLVFAPTLYKDASSFGLWAALANTGTVHSAPVFPNITFAAPNWVWSPRQTLYPSAFRAAGLTAASGVSDLVAFVESQ